MGEASGEIYIHEYSDASPESSDEWRITTSRWEGMLELNLRDRDQIEVVIPAEATYSADDVVVTETETNDEPSLIGDGPTWLLLLPTLLGLLALGIDWLNLFSPASTVGSVGSVALYWPYTLFSIVGTIHLYERASAVSEGGWHANPWLYIVGGGIGFTAVQALLGTLPSTVTLLGASLAGAFLFGCVVASSITGPIYLLVRRHLSDPPRDSPGSILSHDQEDEHDHTEKHQQRVQ